MKIFKSIIKISCIILGLAMFGSCSSPILKSKDEAIKFLESHTFYDESATVIGQNGGQIKSSFSISFNNGKAQIGDENLRYSIEELPNANTMFKGNHLSSGYLIKIYDSERYSFGEEINCFLSSGLNLEGKKLENGAYLLIQGQNIHAYFSSITKGAITKY